MLYKEIIAIFFTDPHKTLKYTVWAERRITDVKLAVHIVTTGLQRVKSHFKKPVS
jgi:hypothetical protein